MQSSHQFGMRSGIVPRRPKRLSMRSPSLCTTKHSMICSCSVVNFRDGGFHASVVSLHGNKAETFPLAIDQLRLLRNTVCRSTSTDMDKKTFEQYIQCARDTFTYLGVKTDTIDNVMAMQGADISHMLST